MRKRASEFDFPDHVLFYSRIILPLFEALHNTTGYFYIYIHVVMNYINVVMTYILTCIILTFLLRKVFD